MLNLADESLPRAAPAVPAAVHPIASTLESDEQTAEEVTLLSSAFPLLQSVAPELEPLGGRMQRFSVTQLINYQRCPRQYYFDRVLHTPPAEAIATWNDAEAPEPPANLTATLKGAVIHRFCETFRSGDEASEILRQSFQDVTAARQAELAERWLDIDTEKVIKDLLPLAENYLASQVFRRVEVAQRLSAHPAFSMPGTEVGLWSELPFRLRRPAGILTGAIDKLLITRASDGKGFDIEIIDFKTNRLLGARAPRAAGTGVTAAPESEKARAVSLRANGARAIQQIAFDFSATPAESDEENEIESIEKVVQRIAFDYQLQMQAYALAVRELMPSFAGESDRIRVTLHFLEPNVEFHLKEDLLDPAACERAIDEAMRAIVAARQPEQFPVRPATTHCRMCNFLDLCAAGREQLRSQAKHPQITPITQI